MKKQSIRQALACASAGIGIILFFLALSCRKQSSSGPANAGVTADSNQVLLQQASSYFAAQKFPLNPSAPGDTLPFSRASLHKTPLWAQARVQSFSFGKGIVVPVNVQEPLSIRVGAGQTVLTASQITWLFMYQDKTQQWHIEVVTRIPGDSTTGYRAKVRVEDWQGNFLKGYLYGSIAAPSDSIIALTNSIIYKRSSGPAPVSSSKVTANSTVTPDELVPIVPALGLCNETDWYGCSTIGDGPTECTYVYTSEECPGNQSAADGAYSTADPDDYGTIGTGPGSPSTAPAVTSITPDASITGNPIVACVYNHLMSPTLANGLKAILSSFADNTVYNITFTLTPGLGDDGMCSYKGNNTFLIQINADEANDPGYSRIWLASTFIHEAFHAKLRQLALATFGEQAISQWPIPIDNMTLAQLESYFEQDAKAANIWESVEHDWMVTNIDQLAASLESFVQAYYATTYASVGSGIVPYEALMYMGLQNSTLYQEQVTNNGLQAAYQTDCANLNEGGKCSN